MNLEYCDTWCELMNLRLVWSDGADCWFHRAGITVVCCRLIMLLPVAERVCHADKKGILFQPDSPLHTNTHTHFVRVYTPTLSLSLTFRFSSYTFFVSPNTNLNPSSPHFSITVLVAWVIVVSPWRRVNKSAGTCSDSGPAERLKRYLSDADPGRNKRRPFVNGFEDR